MTAIKHSPPSGQERFAVTPTDSLLVEILGELRAIHDHLDAEEEANTPKAHAEPRPSAAKPAQAPPAPKRAGSSK